MSSVNDPRAVELAERIAAMQLVGKDTKELQLELAKLLGKNVETNAKSKP